MDDTVGWFKEYEDEDVERPSTYGRRKRVILQRSARSCFMSRTIKNRARIAFCKIDREKVNTSVNFGEKGTSYYKKA